MGIQNPGRIYRDIPTISPDDIQILTTGECRDMLRNFCRRNGHRDTIINGAFKLFRGAVAQPGEPFIVPTRSMSDVPDARKVHNAMEGILANPVTADLAVRGFDAAPGTNFKHHMRGDACAVTLELTNAPA